MWASRTRTVLGSAAGAVLLVGLLPAAPARASEVYQVPAGGSFHVDGHGWGHGIGMSQWGAQGAATLGRSATQILDAYYPTSTATSRTDRVLRVALTRLGGEGRPPVPGTEDRRYECDVSGAYACHLELYAADGLRLQDGGSTPVALPAADRWRVLNDSAGLHVQRLSGGAWSAYAVSGSTTNAGPLTFFGPPTLKMRYLDGSVREYRGQLRAVRTAASGSLPTTMARVNLVSREQYLRSVVSKEMSPAWKPAALEAQAVAARTYAEQAAVSRPTQSWQICDSTWCQVYAGRTLNGTLQEASSTDTAITRTANVVRTYGGQPIVAKFSASNGGWEAAGGTPYLPARQDPWDGVIGNPPNSMHTWTGSLPASALEKAFPAVGRLTAVVVLSRDGHGDWGGRILDVELRGRAADGTATAVRTTGDALRSAYPFSSANRSGLRSSWFQLSRPPADELTLGAWSDVAGTVDLAARVPDGTVAYRTWTDGSGLSAATGLGGVVRGTPVLVRRASGSLEVFARGSNGHLMTVRRPPGGAWGGWQDLGGSLTARPAVTGAPGTDRVDVFVTGSDGQVWQRVSTAPGSWSGWTALGGRVAAGTGPAAVALAPGRYELVVHGTDGAAWRKPYAGSWRGWTDLGGGVAGDPAVASAAGELTVVIRGTNATPYQRTLTTGWRSLGGALLSNPSAAAAPGSGRLDVLGTGTNGVLYVTTRTASGWTRWREVA